MKLTAKQIAKLTPEERRKRNKRLAYNRLYDAKVKKFQSGKKPAKKLVHRKPVKVVTDKIDQLETLIVELRDVRNKEKAIISEIQSIQI